MSCGCNNNSCGCDDGHWECKPAVEPANALAIKLMYESNTNTNPFTDLDKAKLDAGFAGGGGGTGAVGPQGPKGDAGTPGKAGYDGHDGKPGVQGIRGIQGVSGKDGAGLVVEGTKPTLGDIQAITNSKAGDMWVDQATGHGWVSNGGNPAHWTDMGHIQGPQGVQGVQGLQGIQGIDGKFIQSDWTQGDNTKGDFIKNKPAAIPPTAFATQAEVDARTVSHKAISPLTANKMIEADDYATHTVGGTAKMKLDAATATLYITTDGTDAG